MVQTSQSEVVLPCLFGLVLVLFESVPIDLPLRREYDFFNFNTIASSGNLTVTTLVSPSLNANGKDRPLGFAVQIDSLDAQVKYFIPAAASGTLPAGWDGTDGFVANSIVSVPTTFTGVQPGKHTLKVRITMT